MPTSLSGFLHKFVLRFPSILHSFIPDIYIAPLKDTYSEVLSVQLRPKRNVLKSLQNEDTLFQELTIHVHTNKQSFKRRSTHIQYCYADIHTSYGHINTQAYTNTNIHAYIHTYIHSSLSISWI